MQTKNSSSKMIDLSIKERFLDLFYHEISDFKLENYNSMNVFTLKIKNNNFAYDELIDSLSNQLYHFALSRTEVKKLIEEGDFGTLVAKGKEKLRSYKSNEGELGEILLYCMLESHLSAPKILTKLELKTANNDYVKGADGVHLLKLNDKDYQLILGESKLYSDLGRGISSAFDSISKLVSDKQKMSFEVGLVSSQLVKESFDERLYEYLKNILIPSAKKDLTNLDYSFGIFLGFEIEFTKEESKLSNSEFRSNIREKIKNHIYSKIEAINKQIRKSNFSGYNFYFYIIPFSDLQNKRKEIIKELS